LAVVGPTATGKSALALSVAEARQGEIISCDSTAVYRGFDIGTDKVPPSERRGIPHHLVDVVEPTEVYSAARYSREAARVVHDVTDRGYLPILVGGTGLYYRALTRGIFPGPGRNPVLRSRLSRLADSRGNSSLHRFLQRCDPESAKRIQPADEKRIIRALEVYLMTGRTLTQHFAETRSPIAEYTVVTVGVLISDDLLEERITRRVDQQLDQGLLDEIRGLLESGVPSDAGPFGGLVYRQGLQYLRGERDLQATRALIVRENRRYARRQRIWFKKEPGVHWVEGPGERPCRTQDALALLDAVCGETIGGVTQPDDPVRCS